MKLELRYSVDAGGKRHVKGAVVKVETKEESAMLDQVFGNRVRSDGFIAETLVQCRLSEAAALAPGATREHYLSIPAIPAAAIAPVRKP